jgi:Asp-tRNA(Asn)/Glu-tRNA(Gln) amidotransferase A subunit family amidase
LKLSNGACSLAGVLPYNSAFDSAGLFAKSAQDLAYMFQLSLPTLNPSICEKPSWQGLRVGFLSHDILQLSSAEIKTDIAFTEAIVRLPTQWPLGQPVNGADLSRPVVSSLPQRRSVLLVVK